MKKLCIFLAFLLGAYSAGVVFAATFGNILSTDSVPDITTDTGVIPNALLQNASITIQGGAVALGGTVLGVGSAPTFASLNLSATSNQIVLQFGGVTGTLTATPATSNKTWTLPNTTGTIITTGDTGSVTSTMLAGSIAASKLTGTDIATVGTLTAGSTGAGFTVALSTSTITGTLADARLSTNVPLLNAANSFSLINPITTLPESWIGPSSTTGVYFKGGNVGIGTPGPDTTFHVVANKMANLPIAHVENDGNTNFQMGLSSLAPNLASGNHMAGFVVGHDISASNEGYMAFSYAGSGSASNYLSFGLYGSDDLLVIKPNGNVLIRGIKSSSGVRYVCVATDGTLTSQAAACVGT